MTRTNHSNRTNRTLVIYAHPYTGSFNHAVLEATTTALDKANRPYDVIDLYADGFDPRYTVEELALFSDGGTLDPLVTRYQELIKGAARLIVITPIWWNDLPGMLKGFFDKVMKQKWAYDLTPSGVKGRLTHIEQMLVLTTSTSPTWYMRYLAGNAMGSVFLGATAKQLGIQGRRWINFGQVGKDGEAGDRRRADHLQKVGHLVAA